MRRTFLLLVVLCLHCGGQTQTGPGDEMPAKSDSSEAAATEAPASEGPAADTGENATPPAAADTAASSDSAASATSSKPNCAKLPKVDCKVMKGCAWSDKQKCVEEGGM